jgi:3-hydroxybutyryl-CoA dehydratase
VGPYFEDFESGDPVTTRGRTVTEGDIMTFAGLTGDFNELHTNEEFAKQAAFGRRVAHGALVFSISVGLSIRMNNFEDAILAFAGVDKLRFVAPVFIGDTIRVQKRVVERQALGEARGTVVFETKVFNQKDEIVLMYHDKMLVKRRPTAAENPARI